MHTHAFCQKLNKVIAPVFGYGGLYQLLGHSVKAFDMGVMLRHSKHGGLPCEIIPWRVMISAAVYAVAFTHVIGKGFAGFGVDVKFKRSSAMIAVWAGVTAVSA